MEEDTKDITIEEIKWIEKHCKMLRTGIEESYDIVFDEYRHIFKYINKQTDNINEKRRYMCFDDDGMQLLNAPPMNSLKEFVEIAPKLAFSAKMQENIESAKKESKILRGYENKP